VKRFSTKVTTYIVITVILASLVQYVVLDLVYTRSFVSVQLDTNARAAHNLAHDLNEYFQKVLDTLRTIASEEKIYTSQEALRRTNRLTPEVDAFLVFDTRGTIVRSDSPPSSATAQPRPGGYADRDYFQAALAGKEFISDVFLANTSSDIIAVSVPIYNQGAIIGVLAGMIPIRNESLMALFDAKIFGRQGYVQVVDNNGKVLYHTLSERRGSWFLLEPQVEEALTRELSSADLIDSYGEHFYTGLARVPLIDWIVYIQTPSSEIHGIRLVALARGILLVIGLLLVIQMVIFMAVGKLTRPLEQLAKAVEALREGKYQTIPILNTNDEFQLLASAYNDTVRELEDAYHRLRSVADRDGLTGVYNRRSLDKALDALQKDIQEKSVERAAFLFVDLDHFKKYNDTSGHLAGDEQLKHIATILTKIAGDRAVFRYGGEELAVLLRGYGLEQALRLAEAMRREVEQLADVTISIGVAAWPAHAETAAELVAVADKALYKAKETRNAVKSY